ncbi:MAG: hypothetical protein EBZ29_08735 [Synechococcaceae bacterium WB9_4xC_028]|nr:hypothetical protein [Synechococcaceae bacterium WB9_4xC_028]
MTPLAQVEVDGQAQAESAARLTVAGAIEALQVDFWAGKVRTTAAQRTWDRVASELKRLPLQATLSVELLLAVAAGTKAGEQSWLEACKVFKRLGKVAGLGSARCDPHALRTSRAGTAV